MSGKRLGRQTVALQHPPVITAFACVGGRQEEAGPLGKYFDFCSDDSFFGEKTWEKAESAMQKNVLQRALDKHQLTPEDIDYILAGDLLNQCIGSSFGLRDFGIPFFGVYNACSTMGESLALAALLIDGGFAERAAALTSSHFCTAERQYRMPVPYGSQRTPTAQWTVTAAGCTILSRSKTLNVNNNVIENHLANHISDKTDNNNNAGYPTADVQNPESDSDSPVDVYVTAVTCGKIIDKGITDANNMGAAMAPAAYDTLSAFFRETQTLPEDYDLILTGDLGKLGHSIVRDFFRQDGLALGERFQDCGLLLYDRDKQDMHSGGSGCGCSASVLNGYVLSEMRQGRWKKVLFAPTGALLSPVSSFQGESVPGICHAVCLTAR